MIDPRSLFRVVLWVVGAILVSACATGIIRNDKRTLVEFAELPDDAEIQLYLLVGQSNMAGRGKVGEIDREVHPRVFMLTKENEWVPASEPIHFDKPERIGVGPGLAFGKAMAESHPEAVIGLIPSAVGGSVIDTWRPAGFHEQTGVYPYDDAVARVKAATESSGGNVEAILWHQGEYDSRRDKAPLYAGELDRLATDFRRDLDAPKVPFIVGGLGDFLLTRNSDAHTVQAALIDAPNKIEHAAFVSAEGLRDKGDELHFSAEAERELGRRYAEAILHMQRMHAKSSFSSTNNIDQ